MENVVQSFILSVAAGGGFGIRHISFPRRDGGSGERSEPIGAPVGTAAFLR